MLTRPTDREQFRRARPAARGRRLSTRILATQLAILTVTSVIAFVLSAFAQRDRLDRDYEQRALSIAQVTAADPQIRDAMAYRDGGVVQSVAERIRLASGASYVVVIDLNRVRHSHPDPNLIGRRVAEPIAVADGRTHVGFNQGSTGRSANGKAPVFGPAGNLVGEVSAGIPAQQAIGELWRELPTFGLYAALALAIGAATASLLARRLKRITFGLELEEIAGLFQDREAILHGIREGVICFAADGRITMANEEARRLLGLPPDAVGHCLKELGIDPEAARLLSGGRQIDDEVLPTRERLLAVNSRRTDRDGGPPGSVATLRDSTELRVLSERADAAGKRLKLLYDASVALGTTLDVWQTAVELTQVAVPGFADFVTVDLPEAVLRGEEPGDGDFARMRRAALNGVRQDAPLRHVGELIEFTGTSPQSVGLRTGNAVSAPDLADRDGWRSQDVERAERLAGYGIHSLITVPLRARGVILGVADFWRAQKPGPFDAEDVSLAKDLCARAAVCIDNARRYTREHTMAVTLQHSLLPHVLPDQGALEVAYRYLPAQAGVGGDWFDVIPLSGTRVALVVGDVVGHGLHAAATMGRLRTAVHNFAALDLAPDELLWRLDELVGRIDQMEAASGDTTAITGATCLYAVYDPVSGRCALARAGHPPPALAHPDGAVEFLDLPAGPPLGLGGLPFETVEVPIASGSRLVLYTDGLVEDRHRDISVGLDLLRDTLAGDGRTPEETCDAVIGALLAPQQNDDVALLVARTRILPADLCAEWTVPSDPASVAESRAAVAAQLAGWGLAEIGFTTELILSELVTNAIRYAGGPIRIRLLRDRKLICEVYDTSSTSPHLRYAAMMDEGGRGLFLVAQFAERWGTRYTDEGKVIWAEQALPR